MVCVLPDEETNPRCRALANGRFRKVDQNGGTLYPVPNPDRDLEISLDLDVVSAIGPRCHILPVEATFEAKPVWQKDRGCAKRTVADVAGYDGPTWLGTPNGVSAFSPSPSRVAGVPGSPAP
jgi:hypothetical protein